jgi:hypothetical protein
MSSVSLLRWWQPRELNTTHSPLPNFSPTPTHAAPPHSFLPPTAHEGTPRKSDRSSDQNSGPTADIHGASGGAHHATLSSRPGDLQVTAGSLLCSPRFAAQAHLLCGDIFPVSSEEWHIRLFGCDVHDDSDESSGLEKVFTLPQYSGVCF